MSAHKLTLLLAALCTLIACASDPDASNTKKRGGMTFQEGELSDVKIETDSSTFLTFTMGGQGDTTLLFIHGWCINRSFWQDQLRHFKDDYRVVAPDMAGTGASTSLKNKWTMDVLADHVQLIIDTLRLDQVVLVGHALGSEIMLLLAERMPDRVIGLIGVEAFKEVNYEPSQEDLAIRFTALRELYKNPAIMSQQIAKESFYNQAGTNEEFFHETQAVIRLCDAYIGPRIFNAYLEFADESKGLLRDLDHPLYLLNSTYTYTDTTAVKALTDQYQGIWPFPHIGHFPMKENAYGFNKALREVLAEMRD
jgi:pimeloyl-ACP methyl ester carboxylesterase